MQLAISPEKNIWRRSELVRLHARHRKDSDLEFAFRRCIRALDRKDEESYVFWLKHCAIMRGHYRPWEKLHVPIISQQT